MIKDSITESVLLHKNVKMKASNNLEPTDHSLWSPPKKFKRPTTVMSPIIPEVSNQTNFVVVVCLTDWVC